MADVNRGNRPLSPHITVYRPQYTSVTSILRRIAGNVLIVGALLVVWWLLAASTGEAHFKVANAVLTSWFGDIVMLGSLWALWYHLLAGLRHLYWDSGKGFELREAEWLAWIVIVGSVILTVLTVVVL